MAFVAYGFPNNMIMMVDEIKHYPVYRVVSMPALTFEKSSKTPKSYPMFPVRDGFSLREVIAVPRFTDYPGDNKTNSYSPCSRVMACIFSECGKFIYLTKDSGGQYDCQFNMNESSETDVLAHEAFTREIGHDIHIPHDFQGRGGWSIYYNKEEDVVMAMGMVPMDSVCYMDHGRAFGGKWEKLSRVMTVHGTTSPTTMRSLNRFFNFVYES